MTPSSWKGDRLGGGFLMVSGRFLRFSDGFWEVSEVFSCLLSSALIEMAGVIVIELGREKLTNSIFIKGFEIRVF